MAARTTPMSCRALTARQRAVLELVRLGYANKEIALGLGLSLAGVKKHLEVLFRRYGVSSRVALVVAALDCSDLPLTAPQRIASPQDVDSQSPEVFAA